MGFTDGEDSERIPLTTAEWEARLNQQRSLVSPMRRAELEREYVPLRQRFRLLLRKIKEFAGDPRFQRPEYASLAGIAQASLDLSKLLYQEITRIDIPSGDPVAPVAAVEVMLDQAQEMVDRLQRQFSLLDKTCGYAQELHGVLRTLIRGERTIREGVPYEAVIALTRQLIAESPEQWETAPPLSPALCRAKLGEQFDSPVEAHVYSTGIATALTVVRAGTTIWLRPERLEMLTAAALLQDCGCLILNPAFLSAEEDAPAAIWGLCDRHPVVGAALLSGLRGVPTALTRLVAQHHERLTGSGFPRGCTAREMSDLSRLLSSAARFQQLRDAYTTSNDVLAAADVVDLCAARQLWREARNGEFDLTMVSKLLAVHDQALLEAEESVPEVAAAAADPLEELFSEIESAEPAESPLAARHELHGTETDVGKIHLPKSPAAQRRGTARRRLSRPNLNIKDTQREEL